MHVRGKDELKNLPQFYVMLSTILHDYVSNNSFIYLPIADKVNALCCRFIM